MLSLFDDDDDDDDDDDGDKSSTAGKPRRIPLSASFKFITHRNTT